MRLREVQTLTGAIGVSLNIPPDLEVGSGFAADLMSDALRYDLSRALLVSGLANPQVVRTAEMADVAAILMVRGKAPPAETLELAEELGIPFLSTDLTMFETCGRLFAGGLPTRTGDASLFPVRAGRDSFLNVAGGYAAVAVMHRVTRRPGDLVRDALGQPRDTFFSYARQASQVPVLIAASPLVVPLDAGPRVRVTGWWSLPEPAPDVLTAQVPGEVRAFVESGERPQDWSNIEALDEAAATLGA